MRKKKEYGGYFSFELENLGKNNNERFSSICENDKLRMNAARFAIAYSVIEGGYNKIHLPIYMCESIKETIQKYNIDYSFYNINDRLEPIIDSIGLNECILICNYFGVKKDSYYDYCIEKFKNVIFDNTQCFYKQPILKKGIYNVYSPRKFVGVADGAYLIKKDLKKNILKKAKSSDYSKYLLKSIEDGTNAGYKGYLESEARISLEGMREMSNLTYKILSAIDYESIAKKRNENFKVMDGLLKESNCICVSYDSDSYPMIYPFLTEDEELRTRLVDNNVYIPQWWKWVLGTSDANDFERKLSKLLLPIPIDHRYDSNDMAYIAELILGRK